MSPEAGDKVGSTPRASSVCTAWADHEDACPPCDSYSFTEDQLDQAFLVASDVLWNLTGRRWPGVCTDRVWPTARYRGVDGPPRWWPGIATRGPSSAWGWCSCNRSRVFGCSSIPEIALPGRPVDPTSITVMIDGNSFTDFELYDHNKLTRTDGEGWPCCQNLLLADDEPGTWSIAYSFGTLPPVGGGMAAASLGCELALAYWGAAGDAGKCRLPKRVQTITRAGTTIALLDPLKLFAEGLTGLPEVDLWVQSVKLGDGGRRGRLLTRRSTLRRMGS